MVDLVFLTYYLKDDITDHMLQFKKNVYRSIFKMCFKVLKLHFLYTNIQIVHAYEPVFCDGP